LSGGYCPGDRPVYKLPFGLKCHEPFVILYSIHANLSDDVFVIVYLRQKNEFGQNPEENIYTKIGSRTIAPGQLPPTITKTSSDRIACIEYNITNGSWHFRPNGSL
jgi:hypothetical protein